MSSIPTSIPCRSRALPTLWLALAGAVRAGWGAFARHAEERRAIARLSGFSDAQLRDLGIDRSDIVSAVCTARRKTRA